MKAIESKYKIPLVGRYNKAVSTCLKCDHSFMRDPIYGTLFDNMIGFCDAPIGKVAIWECPVCFNKWYYHVDYHYDYFLDAVENGTQKHYK